MIPEAHLVAGLAYGDEGKGSIVDALVRKHNASLVVRYNGGAQAAHNVVMPDGRHHTFAQFGAGSFVPSVRTHLSKYMLVNPLNMMCEEEHLREVGITDIWSRTTVAAKSLIITPYQKALNRIQEMSRGDKKHGSCGQGVGVTRAHHIEHGDKVLFAGDLKRETLTKHKLEFIRQLCLAQLPEHPDEVESKLIREAESIEWIWQQYQHWPAQIVSGFGTVIDGHNHIVFEGAQGVLLDEVYGTAPYYTWTDTTFNNANILLTDTGFNGKRNRVGVVRTYFTRHGAGPFATEDKTLKYPEPHNATNSYQDNFRLGHFDFKALWYAKNVIGGLDYIALNHMDAVSDNLAWLIKARIEEDVAPVGLLGTGPTYEKKHFTE